MILRVFAAAAFCCSVFFMVPAVEASADTAYLIVTQPGSNPTLNGWTLSNLGPNGMPAPQPTNGIVVSHEYKLENFVLTQSTSVATAASGGKAGRISFKATAPLDGSSNQLFGIAYMVPELRVRLDGSSTNISYTFQNCRKTTSTSTEAAAVKTSSIALDFECASETLGSMAASPKSGSTAPVSGGSTVAPAPRGHGVDAYLDMGATPIHLTSFAADQATATALGSKAGVDTGKATTGTLQFSLPLDGSGTAIAALAGHGSAPVPLTVTIVLAGDPISKPMVVERFSQWSVEAMTTSFANATAATDFQIRYGAMTMLKKGTTDTSQPLPVKKT